MNAKPILYKTNSILGIVCSVLSFLSMNVLSVLMIIFNSQIQLNPSLVNEVFRVVRIIGIIPPDRQLVSTLIVYFFAVLLSLFSLLQLFMTYMSSSSTFLFANILNHKNKGIKAPFVKRGPILSANAYRKYSLVMLGIALILCSISVLSSIISTSVEKNVFLALPILPIASNVLVILEYYVNYYLRYKGIADILDVASADSPTSAQSTAIAETKTMPFKVYSVILFILSALFVVGTIVALIIVPITFSRYLGTSNTVYICLTMTVSCVLGTFTLIADGLMFFDLGKTIDTIKQEIAKA